MRYRAAILAALAAVTLLPTSAFCAEAGQAQGSWLTLLFFAINFAIFVVVLAKFAVPPATKYFRDRSAEIRTTLKTTDDALVRAQEMAARAEADLAKLEAEKALLAREMRETTAREVGRIREIAERTAARIKQDAQMASTALAETGRRRIREQLAAVTTNLARDLIEKNFAAADQSHLIDEFMNQLEAETRQ
jgi:F-type H+-transporting ATPase subunit b